MSFKINQRVKTRGFEGYIRFIGNTKFAPGEWIGIELDEPEGKNNGTVAGERYFTCKPKHGLFTKKVAVKAIAVPNPAKGAKQRAGSRLRAPKNSADVKKVRPPAKQTKLTSKKVTTKRDGRLRPPQQRQSPTANKSLSSPTAAGSARKSLLKSPTPVKSPTPPASKAPASKAPASKAPASKAPASKEANPPPRARGSSTSTSAPSDEAGDGDLREELEALREQLADAEKQVSSLELKEFSSSEEIANLKEKLSTEQAARAELEHSLQSVKDDRDINKSRHQETSEDIKRYRNEMATAKSAASKAERKAERLEEEIAEMEENMELLTLEKEESAAALEEKEEEVLELELQLESLRDEIETLKDEGGNVQVTAVAEGATPDMVELATDNAKLRQALQALNDQSKERIADLTRSVRKFERDSKELTKLKKHFNEQKTQNEQLKADVEDLKGRLDDASSYEEMVEELSDENMSMKDKLAELENNLKRQKESADKWKQDYEEEKEFNEELSLEMEDIQEKMQGEIDTKNAQLAQLAEALTSLKGVLGEKQESITTLETKSANLNDERLDLLRQLSQLRSQVALDVNGDGGGGFAGSASNQQALSRSLAKMSVLKQQKEFLLASTERHIKQLSALVPVEVLQAERPGMDVSRLLHRLKTKAKFVLARLLRSDSSTTAAHMQLAAGTPRYTSSHLFGDVNLQQFLRNCAGGNHLAVIVREAGRALALLSNPSMTREEFLAAATAFESPFNVCEGTLNEILTTITSTSNAQQGGVLLRKANIETLSQRMSECAEAVASFVTSTKDKDSSGTSDDTEKQAESVFLPYEILSIARLIVMNAAAFNATLKLAASQLSITEENADAEEVKAQKALLNCGREHAESAWVTACSLMEKILERCQSGLSSVKKSTSITLEDELDVLVAATPEGQVLQTLLLASEKDSRELLVAAQSLAGADGLVATCLQKAPAPVALKFGEEAEEAPPPPPSRFVDLFQRLNGGTDGTEETSVSDSVKEFQTRLQASLRHIESSMLLWMPQQSIEAIESDEHAEVETDEHGVEITHLTPLQQSAFRCRKQLGASKDLPALLQATKDELRLREECVVDQTRKLRNMKMKQQQLQHTLEIQAKQFDEKEFKLKAALETATKTAAAQKEAADAKIQKQAENLKRYSREMMRMKAIKKIRSKNNADGQSKEILPSSKPSSQTGTKKASRVANLLKTLNNTAPKKQASASSTASASMTALEAALTHCSRVSSFWKKRALNKKVTSLSPLNVARANQDSKLLQHRSQLSRLRAEVRDFTASASVVRLNDPEGLTPRSQLISSQTKFAMLQQKCKLFSEHVVDSLRHQDSGSDSADADARTDFTCAPTSTEDFLAARVTVPAGDDYIGSDGVKGTLKLRVGWDELTNIHQRILSTK